jgi:RIO kinase 1
MRIPETLSALEDQGVIERVLRPLMSGKEAQVYLVVCAGTEYVAKVYKQADRRTFKHRATYTEGRKVRNSRDQRAIDKRTQHGKAQDEAAWRSTEVDMIHRLHSAGVRVPVPHNYIDGVLVMELVKDVDGQPAPRLGDLDFTPDEATWIYERLVRDVVRMLCAGVVHGDLSDFNVLLSHDGPVIIDFPQSIDAAKNGSARTLLLRDVENLHRFHQRFVPKARRQPFGEEMWALYENNQLTPETVLRGLWKSERKQANVEGVLQLIGEANEDERRRRAAIGQDATRSQPRPRRVEVVVDKALTRHKAPLPRGPRPQPGVTDGPRPPRPPASHSPQRPPPQRPAHGSPSRGAAGVHDGARPPPVQRPAAAHRGAAPVPPRRPDAASGSAEAALAGAPKRRRRRRKSKSATGNPSLQRPLGTAKGDRSTD